MCSLLRGVSLPQDYEEPLMFCLNADEALQLDSGKELGKTHLSYVYVRLKAFCCVS